MSKQAILNFLPLSLLLAYMPSPAQAQELLTLNISQASGIHGIPTLLLHEGSGLNIGLTGLEQCIKKAWLDDPSRVVVDFDLPPNQGCSQYIHLKRIKGVNFDQIPKTGQTLLTLISEGKKDRQRYRYQVRLGYGSGQAKIYAVSIVPDPVRTTSKPLIPALEESRIRNGLELAKSQGLISPEQGNLGLEDRVLYFLSLVANGSEPKEAAQTAEVSLEVVQKLEMMGRSTPNPIKELPPSTEEELINYFLDFP